jgi:hypothetical protein
MHNLISTASEEPTHVQKQCNQELNAGCIADGRRNYYRMCGNKDPVEEVNL